MANYKPVSRCFNSHNSIRSIDRKLKSQRKLHDTEQLILTVLKRWSVLKPVKNLEERLAILSQNPFERQLIKELCLANWLVWMKMAKRKQLA
jgi:hypothetical protein